MSLFGNLFGDSDPTSSLLGEFAGELVPPTILATLPWATRNTSNNASGTINSAFFPAFEIDPTLWDKLVPYRLIVFDTKKNAVVGGANPSEVQINPLGNGTLSFTPMNTSWEFLLPITPQQLTISDSYSINTTATLRGVLEEHSGVRFKNISIQGTFGVWPGRESIVAPPTTPNALQSIFGGTIAAAQNVATQFTSIINAVKTGSLASKPTTVRPGDSKDPEGGFGTGYYQTMLLTQFLEQYAEAKKNPANASWRLVFDIPKQNQSFIVTPVNFTWNENVNRPMEINYNLQLKAWRRIDLSYNTNDVPLQVTQLSPGILQKILTVIMAAQNTAASAISLIGAVRSDVDRILNVIRQTGILVKQLAAIPLAVSDLPAQLIRDYKNTISGFLSAVNPNTLQGIAKTDKVTLALLQKIKALRAVNEGLSPAAVGISQLGSASTAKAKAAAAGTAAASIALAAGQSPQAAAAAAAAASNASLASSMVGGAGQLGASAAASAYLNPSNVAFTNPLAYPILFGLVPVNSLILNPAQQDALQNELDTVANFTVADLKEFRSTILTLTTQLSNSFGAGNSYFSSLYDQPAPMTRSQPMTLDEYDVLQPLYALTQAYDVLTATSQIDNDQALNSQEFVAALASASGISGVGGSGGSSGSGGGGGSSGGAGGGTDSGSSNVAISKIQVPVPYGLNIEEISMRYLGNPQRWIEIATLNNLREPYIDQDGFQYSLLSNADGRNIVVGSNVDLFIGQKVYLNSSTQASTARKIINIVTLSQTSFLITLDGLANLSVFKLADQAYIQAYLPGTVNGQNVIFVPSDVQAPPFDQISIPSSVANVDLVGLSKVDWLLTPQGDLATTNTGDFRLAAGIPNLVQALTLKFNTKLGSCLLNPTYGLGVKVGTMNSDTNAKDIYNQIVGMITADPRFKGVSGLQVTLDGPALGITVGIQLAGQNGVFPIGFQLPSSS